MTQTASANGYCGIELPDENLPKTYGNDGSNITTISCTYNGRTLANPLVNVPNVVYVKTFTYVTVGANKLISTESQWVPQS